MSTSTTSTGRKLVAPDGGWGWAIALAFVIYFFLVFSLIASFGLIYKSEFKRLGFTGTQNSFIVSTNGGLSMLCGLVNGSLLNKFGTRKVSICSAILMIFGLVTTAYATSFTHFMVSYGIITSIGMGMGMSSYSLALNLYFAKKRSKVTGIATGIYGIGTVLFPQLVSFLLANFTIKDTMLIISAIFGHTLVAAVLLQPVKWHMKVEEVSVEKIDKNNEATTLLDEKTKEGEEVLVFCNDIGTIHASMSSLHNIAKGDINSDNNRDIQEDEPMMRKILRRVVKAFDLSLLTDATFTNILIGLSIDFFVEFSYLWLIPFILMETSLSVEETATFMSVYAVADITFRLCAPYIATVLKQHNRVMYIISLILVLTARTFLVILTNYVLLLFVAAAIGGFRGMRLVYWSLVIPDYAPTERLAAAFGLLFTLNGLCLFIGGPVLGVLRDMSGNYKTGVILLNCISFITIVIWSLELTYKRIRRRRSNQQINKTSIVLS